MEQKPQDEPLDHWFSDQMLDFAARDAMRLYGDRPAPDTRPSKHEAARRREETVWRVASVEQSGVETPVSGARSAEPPRARRRHLGPIRRHILSGVKPGEIFMTPPHPPLLEEQEEEGQASGGRHAPVEWREEDADS